MATIDSVKWAVDQAAKKHGFRCVNVSWEDAARSASGGFGGVSCLGPNISDVRLWERSGKLLYTVRSENWNERLGYVSAADVALMTGNEQRTAAALAPTTLDKYLQKIGTHAAYAGVDVPSLYEPTKDTIFGIRFQTVFLPVAEPLGSPWGTQGPPPATEFCTEVYNYQTRSAEDPKNLLLLATPQGLSVQQDVQGRGKVFFHSVDSASTVHRYWLEAEKSEKQVGGAQVESKEEALEAAKRGKATAVRIGPSSMGTRFNVQMLIQVPLKQRPPPQQRGGFGCAGGFGGRGRGGCVPQAQSAALDAFFGFAAPAAAAPASSSAFGNAPASSNLFGKAPAPVGVSNAARVSRGTKEDTWHGVANKRPERDPAQHGTITVTMYYTVAGGVPSAEDVDRACRDLDALYKQCPSDKRLVDCAEVTAQSKGTAFPPPPPAPPVTVAAPCFVPSPATNASAGKHGAAVSLSNQTVVACQAGHALTSMRGGESFEPPNGWWCDGCGLFLPAGFNDAAAGAAKGYGCRTCDFDLCAGCAVGPRCPAGHGLVARRDLFERVNDTTPCTGCARPFANRAALLRGCPCAASQQAHGFTSSPSNAPVGYALCDQCFRVERAKRGLA